MNDAEYMTPMEFAALPADVHHAVWAVAASKHIDAVAASESLPRRYRRTQVHAIMRDLETARTAAAPGLGQDAGTVTQPAPEPAFAAAGPGGQP